MDKREIKTSLGMFDLLKGLSILLVIFFHTMECYDFSAFRGLNFLNATLINGIGRGCFLCFFAIEGYCFRKKDLKREIKGEFRQLLHPYFLVAIATVGLHFVCHFLAFRSFRLSLVETFRVFAGFAIGQFPTADYLGFRIFSCGPMWFLVASFFGLILLDILLLYVPEKLHWPLVLVFGFLGLMGEHFVPFPFCFFPAINIVAVFYLFYTLKKKKLYRRLSVWSLVLWGLVLFGLGVLRELTLAKDSAAYGISDPLMTVLWAPYLFYLYGSCCNSMKGRVRELLSELGRISLTVYCLHSVEDIGVPWYLFAAKFADRPVLGVMLQFLARGTFIALGSMLVFKVKKSAFYLKWSERLSH